jgi:hypothetical protein
MVVYALSLLVGQDIPEFFDLFHLGNVPDGVELHGF